MNSINMTGRIGKDPEVRYAGETPVANFSLGVPRNKEVTDWINVTAWGKDAEFAEKYLKKGMLIGVTGRLETSTWKDKEGKNRVNVFVRANHFDFLESKGTKEEATKKPMTEDAGFMSIPDGVPEELPFD